MLNKAAGEGTHTGNTYRISGAGPALIRLPSFLAPSQWDAALTALSERFTVIVLGGQHLGSVAALEGRASRTAPARRAEAPAHGSNRACRWMRTNIH